MELTLLPELLSVYRLPSNTPWPVEALQAIPFVCLIRTRDELSIVAPEGCLPADLSHLQTEAGWRAFQVKGPLDFALTGILAKLAQPLAEAKIPIFAVSTFDTDYVLVGESHVQAARSVLEHRGHLVVSLG